MEKRGRKRLPLSQKKRQIWLGLEEYATRKLEIIAYIAGVNLETYIAQLCRNEAYRKRTEEERIEEQIAKLQSQKDKMNSRFDEKSANIESELKRLKRLRDEKR